MDFLKERFNEGYNLVVVRRKKPDKYYCSKDTSVEESGTLDNYDEFNLDIEWPYVYNVIYNIKDFID